MMQTIKLCFFFLLISGANMFREPADNQLWEYLDKNKEPLTITKSGGQPVNDKENILTIGPRGPMLMQDTVFLDESQHFDRERIPERVVHAKGAGAFGYFVVTSPEITKYSKATLFSEVGKRTPILMRFSTVAGERGSADTVRDPRGFAIKFYTEDGIWDMVGNNTPLFFVRDPLMFFSFIHSQKKNPVTNLRDWDTFWDFLTLRPESLHQTMFLFSDKGIPDGFRHMDGYGSNTYKFLNEEGIAFYCKFHFRTNQGLKNLEPDIAEKLAGSDPDYSVRDLYNSISSGDYPSWTFYVQIMSFEEAETFRWNPFDVTKLWPETEFPLIEVGKIVLDRNPTNYFADIEQAAFAPSNMVPGIEASPDKMLQGRLFSYQDTHYYRLGVNHKQLPVNSPFRSIVANTQRDGFATYSDNEGGAPNYFPSSFSNRVCRPGIESGFRVSADVARFNSSDDDNYSQPNMMWKETLAADERTRLVRNLADSIKRASPFIQDRAVDNFMRVNLELGTLLKNALK